MKVDEYGTTGAATIVFLHGGNVAGWMWGAQVPAFDDFHVLVPDLPGFGASNGERWPGLAGAADAVAQLLRERATGGRAHVVGLSLGSSVAIELALRHPHTVTTLFLASASVTPQRSPLAPLMFALWGRRWFWSALARGYGLPADAVELFIETGLGIRVETARAVYAEVSAGTDVSALSVPTLAVAGGRDQRAISRDSLTRFANAATAPGMHHQWNIENVELFNAAVREWMVNGVIAEGLDTRRE